MQSRKIKHIEVLIETSGRKCYRIVSLYGMTLNIFHTTDISHSILKLLLKIIFVLILIFAGFKMSLFNIIDFSQP